MSMEKETYRVHVCHICATKLHYGYYDSRYYLECFNNRCYYGSNVGKTKERLLQSLPFEKNISQLPQVPYLKTTNNIKWIVIENNIDALYSLQVKDEIIESQTAALDVLENVRKMTSVKRAIIAGGAPRDWFLLWKEPADIDIFMEGDLNIPWFCDNFSDGKKLKYQYKDHGYDKDFIVQDAILNDDMKFQFISFQKGLSLEKHIDGFDFGICKIAFDGRFYANEDFMQDKGRSLLKIRKQKWRPATEMISKKRFDKIVDRFPGWEMEADTKTLYEKILAKQDLLIKPLTNEDDLPF